MSLIHSCRLKRSNPFDYLVTLVRQSKALGVQPVRRFLWNFRDALAAVAPATDIG